MHEENPALQTILTRRPIRRCTGDPVSREQIDVIRTAAWAAPPPTASAPGSWWWSRTRASADC